jgi:uncharacterized protein YpmS
MATIERREMNPIINYVLSNWKFLLYILLAILILVFFIVRGIKFATEGQDGKINEIHFNSADDYNDLCLPITGRPCTEPSK